MRRRLRRRLRRRRRMRSCRCGCWWWPFFLLVKRSGPWNSRSFDILSVSFLFSFSPRGLDFINLSVNFPRFQTYTQHHIFNQLKSPVRMLWTIKPNLPAMFAFCLFCFFACGILDFFSLFSPPILALRHRDSKQRAEKRVHALRAHKG